MPAVNRYYPRFSKANKKNSVNKILMNPEGDIAPSQQNKDIFHKNQVFTAFTHDRTTLPFFGTPPWKVLKHHRE